MKKPTAFLAVATVMVAAGVAQAGLIFDGKTVSAEHDFSSLGAVYNGPFVGVVGAGVEFGPMGDGYYTVDVSDTNILLDFNGATSWTGASFNGTVIKDVNSTIADFLSVTINGATNLVGLDASRITFTANQININMQGLSFDANTIVSIDVTAVSAVPLPPAAWMGLVTLGGVGLAAHVRRRRSAPLA